MGDVKWRRCVWAKFSTREDGKMEMPDWCRNQCCDGEMFDGGCENFEALYSDEQQDAIDRRKHAEQENWIMTYRSIDKQLTKEQFP